MDEDWLGSRFNPLGAHLFRHVIVRYNNETLGAEAEPEDGAVRQEELKQRHEDRLPDNLADVSTRLWHAICSVSPPLTGKPGQPCAKRAACTKRIITAA